MTLVKLDSGDYINTDKIEIISKTENINTGKNSTFVMPHSDLYALISNSNTVNLTTSDRDRIVEAMSGVTKSCKYCKSDGDWVCNPDRDEAFAVSEKTDGSDGYLETYLNSKIVTIHYCPMCGRKLGHAHV